MTILQFHDLIAHYIYTYSQFVKLQLGKTLMSLIIFNPAHKIIIFSCSCPPVSSRDRIKKIKQNPNEFTTNLCRSAGEMLQLLQQRMNFSACSLVRLNIHYLWKPICAKSAMRFKMKATKDLFLDLTIATSLSYQVNSDLGMDMTL